MPDIDAICFYSHNRLAWRITNTVGTTMLGHRLFHCARFFSRSLHYGPKELSIDPPLFQPTGIVTLVNLQHTTDQYQQLLQYLGQVKKQHKIANIDIFLAPGPFNLCSSDDHTKIRLFLLAHQRQLELFGIYAADTNMPLLPATYSHLLSPYPPSMALTQHPMLFDPRTSFRGDILQYSFLSPAPHNQAEPIEPQTATI